MSGITIEVRQHDWGPGFAAYEVGSVDDGPAKVTLNLGAALLAVESGDIPKEDLPYHIAESLTHEVMHVLEDWANVEFDCDRIDALLQQYRKVAVKEKRRWRRWGRR